MTDNRAVFVEAFNDLQPAFLAALDQIVAEVRPKLALPGFYEQSLIGCAMAFADPKLVRDQLIEIHPDLMARVTDDLMHDAHLATVAYLFSLALHELIKTNQKELPQ